MSSVINKFDSECDLFDVPLDHLREVCTFLDLKSVLSFKYTCQIAHDITENPACYYQLGTDLFGKNTKWLLRVFQIEADLRIRTIQNSKNNGNNSNIATHKLHANDSAITSSSANATPNDKNNTIANNSSARAEKNGLTNSETRKNKNDQNENTDDGEHNGGNNDTGKIVDFRPMQKFAFVKKLLLNCDILMDLKIKINQNKDKDADKDKENDEDEDEDDDIYSAAYDYRVFGSQYFEAIKMSPKELVNELLISFFKIFQKLEILMIHSQSFDISQILRNNQFTKQKHVQVLSVNDNGEKMKANMASKVGDPGNSFVNLFRDKRFSASIGNGNGMEQDNEILDLLIDSDYKHKLKYLNLMQLATISFERFYYIVLHFKNIEILNLTMTSQAYTWLPISLHHITTGNIDPNTFDPIFWFNRLPIDNKQLLNHCHKMLNRQTRLTTTTTTNDVSKKTKDGETKRKNNSNKNQQQQMQDTSEENGNTGNDDGIDNDNNGDNESRNGLEFEMDNLFDLERGEMTTVSFGEKLYLWHELIFKHFKCIIIALSSWHFFSIDSHCRLNCFYFRKYYFLHSNLESLHLTLKSSLNVSRNDKEEYIKEMMNKDNKFISNDLHSKYPMCIQLPNLKELCITIDNKFVLYNIFGYIIKHAKNLKRLFIRQNISLLDFQNCNNLTNDNGNNNMDKMPTTSDNYNPLVSLWKELLDDGDDDEEEEHHEEMKNMNSNNDSIDDSIAITGNCNLDSKNVQSHDNSQKKKSKKNCDYLSKLETFYFDCMTRNDAMGSFSDDLNSWHYLIDNFSQMVEMLIKKYNTIINAGMKMDLHILYQYMNLDIGSLLTGHGASLFKTIDQHKETVQLRRLLLASESAKKWSSAEFDEQKWVLTMAEQSKNLKQSIENTELFNRVIDLERCKFDHHRFGGVWGKFSCFSFKFKHTRKDNQHLKAYYENWKCECLYCKVQVLTDNMRMDVQNPLG